jgi:tetratricopeptide (TPR) repeat protein
MSVITAINAGKNDLALSYSNDMFKLARATKDSLLLAHSYNQRGIIYKEKGDLENAIDDYVEASRIYDNIKNPGLVNAHTNIAIAYNILGQDTMALKWFKTAYKQAENYEVPSLEIRATNNLANHFKTLKQYDSSEVYFNKLLAKENQLYTFYKTLLYQNLSELALYDKDFDTSMEYLKLAKPLILSGSNVERKIQIYSQSSKLEDALENYNKSLEQLDSAIFIAKQYQLPNRLFPLYLRKAEIHKTLEDYQPAAEYYQLYTSLRDSLQNLQEMEVIQESIAQYELDSREQAMKDFIEREQGLKSNLYIIGGISLLLLISTLIIYKRYQTTKSKHQKSKELIDQKSSELENLKSQLKQENMHKKIRLKTNTIINCNDLVYIKSDGHYLEYYLENRNTPIIERQTFNNVISVLRACGFVRVHRSYVINTQKVESISTNVLQLSHSIKIPFSRTYKQKLRQQNHPLLKL